MTLENIKTDEKQPRFEITKNAATRISYLLQQEENSKQRLRISVLGGGCSGFQYHFDFDPDQKDDDAVFEKNTGF